MLSRVIETEKQLNYLSGKLAVTCKVSIEWSTLRHIAPYGLE